MSITLKDIANDVGVSISTVSRTLNRDSSKKSSPETETKIWEAAQRLGYAKLNLPSDVPELSPIQAGPPAAEKSIAIILASEDKNFSHPFFGEMLSFLLEEINKSGYPLKQVLSASSMSAELFRRIISAENISGAIIIGRLDNSMLKFLKEHIPHLVYTGVNYIGKGTDEVICDGYKAISMLFEHFIKLGYKSIGYIGPISSPSDTRNEFHRFESYRASLAAHDMHLNSNYIRKAKDTAADGYNCMKDIISSSVYPRAIICAADTIAAGAIRACFESGIHVPKDIAIAGIDNINISEYLCPALTTIDIPKDDLSRLAMNMLIDQIENNRNKQIRLDVPFDLKIRESCGAKD